MKSVGARIKQLRLVFNMKQEDLANLLGVTVGSVNGWEGGRTTVTYSRLVSISNALHARVEWLEKGEGNLFAEGYESVLDDWLRASSGNRIAWLREELEITRDEFADKLRISSGSIGMYERNERSPERYYPLISDAYNVRREWLETGEGSMLKTSEDNVDSAPADETKPNLEVQTQPSAPLPVQEVNKGGAAALAILFQLGLGELPDEIFGKLSDAVKQEAARRSVLASLGQA